MTYTLKCPDCLQDNTVETDTPIIEWTCQFCGATPTTSLPTDELGNLI